MAHRKVIAGITTAIAAVYICGIAVFSFYTYPGTELYQQDIGFIKKSEAEHRASELMDSKSIKVTNKDKDLGEIILHYVPPDHQANLYDEKAFLWPINILAGHTYGESPTLDTTKAKNDLADLTAGGKEPEDAYLKYEDGRYLIVPEKEGTIIDQEGAYSKLQDAIETGKIKIDVSSCKKTAEVTKDNEKLKRAEETANKMLSTEIAYKRNDIELSVSDDEKQSFIRIDEEENVSLDRDAVLDYALRTISGKFDSKGNGVTLTRPDGSTLSVEGGNWGYNVDSEKEADAIIEAMTAGENRTGEPIYKQDGNATNTYVEVDIENQQVRVVVDGQEKLVSDCVTGNISNGHGTHTGAYYIYAKLTEWTMKKYDAFVHYWMPFNGDEGLHDASWRSSFGGSIYKTNGSHGCTNLPYDTAKFIYDNCPTGTLVVVH